MLASAGIQLPMDGNYIGGNCAGYENTESSSDEEEEEFVEIENPDRLIVAKDITESTGLQTIENVNTTDVAPTLNSTPLHAAPTAVSFVGPASNGAPFSAMPPLPPVNRIISTEEAAAARAVLQKYAQNYAAALSRGSQALPDDEAAAETARKELQMYATAVARGRQALSDKVAFSRTTLFQHPTHPLVSSLSVVTPLIKPVAQTFNRPSTSYLSMTHRQSPPPGPYHPPTNGVVPTNGPHLPENPPPMDRPIPTNGPWLPRLPQPTHAPMLTNEPGVSEYSPPANSLMPSKGPGLPKYPPPTNGLMSTNGHGMSPYPHGTFYTTPIKPPPPIKAPGPINQFPLYSYVVSGNRLQSIGSYGDQPRINQLAPPDVEEKQSKKRKRESSEEAAVVADHNVTETGGDEVHDSIEAEGDNDVAENDDEGATSSSDLTSLETSPEPEPVPEPVPEPEQGSLAQGFIMHRGVRVFRRSPDYRWCCYIPGCNMYSVCAFEFKRHFKGKHRGKVMDTDQLVRRTKRETEEWCGGVIGRGRGRGRRRG